MYAAVLWGALASATLFLGQLLARPLGSRPRVTALIMGFGAGTLLSAISYELLPKGSAVAGVHAAAWLLGGALVYYAIDRLLDRVGAGGRHEITKGPGAASGAAMFTGAALDGIPESIILGMGLAVGGAISVAFFLALLVSNVPQGVAGTTGLKAAGVGGAGVTRMWASLTVVCGLASGLGYALADRVPHEGLELKAFAAGALLMMLADSMIPEAYQHGGRIVGLSTVLGFLAAAVVSLGAQ